MHKRILQWILLILILTACQVSKGADQEIILRSTILPDVYPAALDDNTEQKQKSVAGPPGWIQTGMRGADEDMVSDSHTTYHIRRGLPFIGEYYLRSGKLEPHSYVFLCLLDYVQIPCNPDAEPFQFVENIGEGDVARILLQLAMDEEGIHDVVVLHQADPYLPGSVGYDESLDRTQRDMGQFRSNVLVNAIATAPPVQYITPASSQPGDRSIESFVVSDPRSQQGSPNTGWPLWTEATAKAGELFDVDLHFDGDMDRRHAVVALIDFQQAPIFVKGETHLPLFVETKEATWQSMSIRLRAPELPGNYELRFVTLGEPFAVLDSLPPGKNPNALASPQSSPRILLRVE